VSNELEEFLTHWDRETDGTLALMRLLPTDQYDFRPDAGGRSIGELALHLSEIEAYVTRGIERNEFTFEPPHVERPATIDALAPAFLAAHQEARTRIAGLQADDLGREIRFADGTPWSIRHLLWRKLLLHAVHHRGQLTLLCRLAEGFLRGCSAPPANSLPRAEHRRRAIPLKAHSVAQWQDTFGCAGIWCDRRRATVWRLTSGCQPQRTTMMQALNAPAIIAATVAAFLFSSIWYVSFGNARMRLLNNDQASADVRTVPTAQKLFEVLRSFIVVIVIAHLLSVAGVTDWVGAVGVGIWLGVFPVMILVGATLWDKRPWRLSAIHGGDWLFKILIVSIILGMWR
jgi:uncharacterized damage-inducible protein DinB